MKHTKLLTFVLLAALTLSFAGCGSSGTAVFVQSVAELSNMGGIAPGDRFAGVVVSENVAEIQKDQDKTVAELFVKEGQDVTEGQELFAYDTDQLQLDLDKKKLELEQLKASIENYTEQLEDLKKAEKKAPQSQKLEYSIQIQTVELDLREAELNLTAKEAEIAQAEAILANAVVVSPVTGRVQSISENGYDNYGNPLPYIAIQQSGAYRIKGSIGELQRGGLMEGTRLKIVSRTDEAQFWTGTVTLVDYENPSQGNSSSMYYTGGSSDETTSSSKYPFYVELDSTEGLILGQHVYMELEDTTEGTAALALSSAFIAYDEEGNPFVWAESKGKLEQRPVELGEYNYMNDTMEILSGLTEEDFIAFPDDTLCQPGVPTTHTAPVSEPEGEVG